MRSLPLALLTMLAVWPAHAADTNSANYTVATVVFQTPDGRGADSHVYDGTLDSVACQDKLAEIESEWPDVTPLVGYCTPITQSAVNARPTTLPCMRVEGLERAKRGCV